jgi:hypothetical protein
MVATDVLPSVSFPQRVDLIMFKDLKELSDEVGGRGGQAVVGVQICLTNSSSSASI